MLGSLLSAGANIVGGLLGSKSASKANEAAAAQAAQEREMQKEFAQNGIRWKVADAKAAGIHPLYALGANTVSYQPNTVGQVVDDSMSRAMGAVSQDLSRAFNTTRTESERDQAFASTVQALSLEKMGLENELLGSQIAKLRQTPNPPLPTLSIAGNEIKQDETTSSSDLFQGRYGEPGEWISAPIIMWQDYKKNYPNSALTYLDNTTPRQNLRDAWNWIMSGRKSPGVRRQRGWGGKKGSN